VFQRAVLKLLSKSVDLGERYQSADGALSDLRYCLDVAVGARPPQSDFALGRTDLQGTFQVSQKLHGRDAQVQQLLAAYAQLLPPFSRGPQSVFVAGFSGIGQKKEKEEEQ
jgi:hypothetical protein